MNRKSIITLLIFMACLFPMLMTAYTEANPQNRIDNNGTVADSVAEQKEESGKIFQTGKATHYGRSWNGRRTSSGERLDMDGYQCAHRTLPFGTLVRVTNTKTGKSCIVKVVDRGPFGKGKVIDLTIAPTKKIGMWGHGVAPVTLEIVENPNGWVLRDGELVDPATLPTYNELEDSITVFGPGAI